MRSEQTLGSYSFENVALHLLRRRLVVEHDGGVVTDLAAPEFLVIRRRR